MNAFGKSKVVPLERERSRSLAPMWSGFHIGNCRIDNAIDRSAVAITYHGHEQVLGRPVLIRECAPTGMVRRNSEGQLVRRELADARAHAEILREFSMRARSLANLSHQGLIRVHGLLTIGDSAYLIMPIDRGLRLDQRIRSLGPLTTAELVAVKDGMLDTLEYLHAQDLVHRAVRPSRVRLAEDGSPQLLDFGLAINHVGAPACNDLTRYSAPEEFARQPHSVGPPSDLYALAATLCFALTGLQPPTPPERVAALRAQRPDPIRALLREVATRCEPALLRTLGAALSMNPARRPASVAAWRVLERQPVPAARPATKGQATDVKQATTRPARPDVAARRRYWLAGLGAAASIALVWWSQSMIDPGSPPTSEQPARQGAAVSADGPIRREAAVPDLLRQAEVDVAEGRLVTPAGNNAEEKLRKALQLAPDNETARQGLDNLVERLIATAQTARGQGDLVLAEQHLAQAERLAPDRALVSNERRALDALTRPAPPPATRASTNPLPPLAGSADTVVIAAATFMMGSVADEADRGADERLHLATVQDYQLGRHEVTVAEFGRFVEATGYVTDAERDAGGRRGCLMINRAGQWEYEAGTHWRQPGFSQTSDHPVVCVSLADASAYADWRRQQTGLPYRLPTEAEWEYAARKDGPAPGAAERRSAGTLCERANAADLSLQRVLQPTSMRVQNCDDGNAYTAAVGTSRSGPGEIADLLGNVREWTCSDYDATYEGAEQVCGDLSPGVQKVVRGGGWSDPPAKVRAAHRGRLPPGQRYADLGFRVAIGGF